MIFGKPPDHLIKVATLIKDFWKLWVAGVMPLLAATMDSQKAWFCKKLVPQSQDNDTSSTAQGGGGSFKNRKPIGEVGCRESRMAERSH